MGSMNLVLPEVGITPGPTWGTLLNDALVPKIEEHDHSPGSGVYVKTSGSIGIDVNGDMSFKKIGAATYSRATDVKSIEFIGAPVYPVAGNLNLYADASDLFFRDGSGVEIQITSGGTVPSAKYGLTDTYDTTTLGSGKLGYLAGNVYKFTDGDASSADLSSLSGFEASNISSLPGGNFLLDVAAAGGTATLGSAGTMTVKSDADVVVTSGTEMGLTTTAGHLTLTSTLSTSNIALVGGTGSGNGCTFSGGSSSMSIFRNIDITASANLTGGGRVVALVANNGSAKLETTRGATLIKAAHTSAGLGTVTLESNADVILEPGAPITANYCTTTPNTILITDNETDPGNLETVDVGHRNRQNCISARATFDVVALTSVTPRANRWNVASAAYTVPGPVAGQYSITLNEAIPSDASIIVMSNEIGWTGLAGAAYLNGGLTNIDVVFAVDVTVFSLIVVGA